VEWNDGTDDDGYPVAPVPAHERVWRHPSEIGQAQWVRTEPPLTVGRGLVAATTTFGGLLTIAVVWAMWPSTGSDVTAISTIAPVVDVVAAEGEPSLTTSSIGLIEPTNSTTLVSAPPTLAAPASTIDPDTSGTNSTEVRVSVTQAPSVSIETVVAALPRAAAVAIDDDTVVLVTTAAAVGDRAEMQVTFDGVAAVDVAVVFVDDRRGLAVLSAEADVVAGLTPLTLRTTPNSIDTVTPLVDADSPLALVSDTDGRTWVTGWDTAGVGATPEGMPLVDDSGLLVGLCMHSEDRMLLVPVDRLGDLQSSKVSTAAPWMGIVLDTAASDALTIGFVDPAGPAATGGLRGGDVIVAVDNLPVLTQGELDATLRNRQPGDIVAVTVRRADVTVSAQVTLAASTAAL
jgi:S1-C subfamily serine protease